MYLIFYIYKLDSFIEISTTGQFKGKFSVAAELSANVSPVLEAGTQIVSKIPVA